MQLLDGKHIAQQIEEELRLRCETLLSEGKRTPTLAIVLVGNNPASEIYVHNKMNVCGRVGIGTRLLHLPENISQDDLLQTICALNADAQIDGFIVQFPLPQHLCQTDIISAIDYRKDVDGLTPTNIGRLALGMPCLVSATPKGILELFHRYHLDLTGKRVVVIGRSNIVGRPLSILLSSQIGGNATVTLCHSKTQELREICLAADVIVVAVGKPHFLRADMVKQGAIIIDVGISRINSKLIGDVDFENVAPKCSFITPVPGGIGPMTIISLLQNILQAYQNGFL